MPRRKMIPALPDAIGGSEHDRFKMFAKAILAVPKSEIMPAEHVLTKLEAQKRKIEGQLAAVRREMAKRKSDRTKD